jgi:hypothetical protein
MSSMTDRQGHNTNAALPLSGISAWSPPWLQTPFSAKLARQQATMRVPCAVVIRLLSP